MAGEEFVKFGAVAPRHPRRMRDVAFSDLQQLAQVIELKLIPRLNKGRQRGVFPFQRLLHQGVANDRRRG